MYEELPGAKGNPFRSRVTSLSGVSVLSVMTTPDKAYRWWYRVPLTKILFKGSFAKIDVRNGRWTNYASVTAKTPPARTDASADRAGIRGTVTMPTAPGDGALCPYGLGSAWTAASWSRQCPSPAGQPTTLCLAGA